MEEVTIRRLADGTPVRLRALRRDDREKLRRGFERLSPQSKYRRFFSTPAHLSDASLDYLTNTDGWSHVAIGAELGAPDADTSYGIGIARFVRGADDPTVAEAAVAVIDEMQRRGLGRLLLRELVAAARERGVTTFVCHVLPDNEPVRGLLADLAAESAPRLEDGLLTYRLAIPDVLPDEGPIYRLFRLAADGMRVVFRRLPGPAAGGTATAGESPGSETR